MPSSLITGGLGGGGAGPLIVGGLSATPEPAAPSLCRVRPLGHLLPFGGFMPQSPRLYPTALEAEVAEAPGLVDPELTTVLDRSVLDPALTLAEDR